MSIQRSYLLGIDLGTSSLRSAIIDRKGGIVGIVGKEYPTLTPCSDWAEQDVDDWWNALRATVKTLLDKYRINSNQISAIGLSGQMHGTVLVDKNGRPVYNAIPWVDKRSSAQCSLLKKKIGEKRLYAITGSPVFPGFMAASLLWVKKERPDLFKRVYRVLSPKDYLRYRLTGEFFAEPTDGCATLLMDVKKKKWSPHILSKAGIPSSILPEIIESADIAGRITSQAARQTGLSAGTLVIAGGGDQAMGAIGCGIIKEGVAASTIGTGGQFTTVVSSPVIDTKRRIHTLCHALPGKWILMGATLSAGMSLKWFRDNFAHARGESYGKLDREAEKIVPGCGGLMFLPYLIGERTPHMDSQIRGGFFGLSVVHGRSHMIRAIMEGVAYSMKESLDIFSEMGMNIKKIVASGGGGKSNLWRQIQADIYGRNIYTLNHSEHSVYGAALLAGITAGTFTNAEQACRTNTVYSLANRPVSANSAKYKDYYKLYRRAYPLLKRAAYK